MFERKKRALITGGAGFIGWHLHNTLEEKGYKVISIDNFSHHSKAPRKAVFGDIRHADEIEPYVAWADSVFHLAAQIHVDHSIEKPAKTININVNGTLKTLELCRKYKKQFVFASSSEIYGSSQSDFMSEAHPLDGQSPYAASKILGDRLCKSYHDTYGLDVRILRNFNVFGPFQNDEHYGAVIAKFTRAAFKNEPITIFGDGKQLRDFMHIDDAIEGYRIMSEEDQFKGQVLNVGTGKPVSVNHIAELVKKITKSASPIVYTDPRPGEIRRLCADVSKAREFGFESKTDFERDLARYINWYKEFNKL